MQLPCLEPDRCVSLVVALGVVADGFKVVLDVWQSRVAALVELGLNLFECHGTLYDFVIVGIVLGVWKFEKDLVERITVHGIGSFHDSIHELLAVLRHLLDRKAVDSALDSAHAGNAGHVCRSGSGSGRGRRGASRGSNSGRVVSGSITTKTLAQAIDDIGRFDPAAASRHVQLALYLVVLAGKQRDTAQSNVRFCVRCAQGASVG